MRDAMAGFTDRQLEVIALISYGYPPREVAVKLKIEHLTVTWHLHQVYRKMGFTNVMQLTRWAVLNGLDDPEPAVTPRPKANPKMRGFFGLR
jgi:DNA-binding CsgD family transcriptional regulator